MRPRFLFLFINPTHLNVSSHKSYRGKRRYPFVGVRHFYRLLSRADFVSEELMRNIYQNGWQLDDENRIEKSLTDNGVYITNLVKCTQSHPQSPQMKIIKENFPLLKKEINIVSPRYIIAFGRLPLKILTGKNLYLKDFLERVRDGNYLPLKSVNIFRREYDVLPCYFPVGRGNPGKALEILKHIKRKYTD